MTGLHQMLEVMSRRGAPVVRTQTIPGGNRFSSLWLCPTGKECLFAQLASGVRANRCSLVLCFCVLKGEKRCNMTALEDQ
jgi:hypothetical protein